MTFEWSRYIAAPPEAIALEILRGNRLGADTNEGAAAAHADALIRNGVPAEYRDDIVEDLRALMEEDILDTVMWRIESSPRLRPWAWDLKYYYPEGPLPTGIGDGGDYLHWLAVAGDDEIEAFAVEMERQHEEKWKEIWGEEP